MDARPCAGAGWLEARDGLFRPDDDFYEQSGGMFL